MTTIVDPITLEVLRHRLWMINDEQGQVATQISGSPVVYEAKDFNSVLQDASGDCLFIGIYTTRLSLCLDTATKTILHRFGQTIPIRDGDAFITSDPWGGALHQNDLLMVAPIFWEDRVVSWTGVAMHDVDVGGPTPGSFTVGSPDVFGEGPLIPPVKLVDQERFRPDVEAWATRNSRTADLNALNLRARWAALNRTRQRIRELIEEYGVDTYLAVQSRILELTLSAFQRRLRSLPDGTWTEEGFLDHDGNTNELYRICLEMTKRGDRLTFDFRGTSAQVPGSVNCTRVGLESGVLSAILPTLCFDMAWSPGGIRSALEIISDEGTINNARHPAGVSMGSVGACFATQHVASAAIGKMLACSDMREEAQANWTAAWQGIAVNGRHRDGTGFTGILMDQAGGGGASLQADGIDTGGMPGSPSQGIANVESYERLYPILYVYRKQCADTGGAGRTRGGVGTEVLIVPHRAQGDIDLTVLCHGASQPEARGLYGGYPSSIQVRLILRDAHLQASLKESDIPHSLEDVRAYRLEPLAAKQRTVLRPSDAFLAVCAGGGGCGDPLQRDPARVAADVDDGLVSRAIAEAVYGVCLEARRSVTDPAATQQRRAAIRAERLAQGARPQSTRALPNGEVVPFEATTRVGDALLVAVTPQRVTWFCQACHTQLGQAVHAKEAAQWREIPMTTLSHWNRFGLVDAIAVREFYCPECGHMFGVEVRKAGDPPLLDTRLAPVEQVTSQHRAEGAEVLASSS